MSECGLGFAAANVANDFRVRQKGATPIVRPSLRDLLPRRSAVHGCRETDASTEQVRVGRAAQVVGRLETASHRQHADVST